ELAAQLNLNPKTIRYYEQIGLVPAPARTPAGYRLYGLAEQDRLRFIVQAKAIGLTLQEIGQILAARTDGQCPCDQVMELIDQKLADVDAQLRALHEARQDLHALREEATTISRTDARVCAIIEQHEPPASLTRAPSILLCYTPA
ncbi:MAG TPA: MerR family DNA-binding protein, partial [Chloroflexota bacterium]|nr:MerR family DNA-binding protein [Chloroflexota bacterium]